LVAYLEAAVTIRDHDRLEALAETEVLGHDFVN
jgi:hypothetical protein